VTDTPAAPGDGWALAVAAAALFAAAYPVVVALAVRRRSGVGWRWRARRSSRSAGPGAAGHLRDGVRRVLADVGASPAARLFAAVWLASALAMTAAGPGFPFGELLIVSFYLLASLLTVAITRAAPDGLAAPSERPRLRLHIGLVLLFVLLTAWRGLSFHRVLPADASIPLWSPLVDAVQRLGDRWFGNGNYLANPVLYAALPFSVLLLAGARPSSLGFGRGHRVGRVLLLWCALPAVFFAHVLLSGQLTATGLAGRFLSHSLNNGFFEEFLFRGALQTRLRRLWGPGWALVLQALVFGAWHLGLGFTDTGHTGVLPALASTLVHQAVVGLGFGVIFERTRNLLAPSVVHVVANSLG
jgi:membrane protease YdiL (CAAX protease family)